MNQPKFIYKQKVKVVRGFYLGQKGIVEQLREHSILDAPIFGKAYYYSISITTKEGYRDDIYVDENELARDSK